MPNHKTRRRPRDADAQKLVRRRYDVGDNPNQAALTLADQVGRTTVYRYYRPLGLPA